MQGLIVKIISGDYIVKIDNELINCKPLGVFRHKKITPKVGDIVKVKDNTIIEIIRSRIDCGFLFVFPMNTKNTHGYP